MPNGRRKKGHAHENHERWLVSYADFITLLFAFFVVMFASSQVNKKKVGGLAAYFEAYIKDGNARAAQVLRDHPGSAEAATDSKPSAELATMGELAPVREQLSAELAKEIAEGKVALSIQPRGLVLSLRESALFPPGQDMFNPEAVPLLSKVAEALRKLPDQPVRLEGHTDNVPIETERFPSNWELSAARANAVLELLCGRLELDPRRFAVAGYADYHPVADNSTSEGRGHNRRVDIVVLSRSAAEMEPRQQPDDNRASR
jgi:chemotaxis protein MotB